MNYTGNNLTEVINGLDSLLDTLQNAVDSQVFGNQLPLLGDSLKGSTQNTVKFISNFEDDILNKLHEKLDGATQQTPELIRQALVEALGSNGLNLLKDLDGNGLVNDQDIKIQVSDNADDVQFNLKLSQGTTSSVFSTAMDADLGLPALGLNVNGDAQVGIGYEFNLKFGVNKTNGFYFDTSAADELKVNLNTFLLGANATGTLGFLQLNATDKGTQFNGNFTVDLKDSDGQLRSSELPSVNLANLVDAKLNGTADVNLNLVTSFGGSASLPSLSADFNLNWAFNNADAEPNQTQSLGNIPSVAFNNVKLDVSTFFSNFTRPVLEKVQKITEPIKPLIDILTTPIDLKVAKFTLLDIAQGLGYIDQPDRDFIESTAQLIQIIDSIPTLSSDISIDLGSFNLGNVDVRATDFNLSSVDPSQHITRTANSVEGQLQNGSQEKTFVTRFKSIPGKGLEFPILTDANQAFNLLLGREANLFTYDMPDLSFELGYQQSFPIIGPLFGKLGGRFGAGVNLAFGYDTAGLQEFAKGTDGILGTNDDFSDTSRISNGFFVSDPDTPETTLTASLEAFAEVNGGIAAAGVGGGIFANIGFDLKDPTPGDKKVRLTELEQLLSNPLTLFDTYGELTAGLSAYLQLGIDPFSYTKRLDSPRVTLLNFNQGGNATSPKLTLAKDIGGGVIELNMGLKAADRLTGNTNDEAEVFIIQHESGSVGNEKILVSAFNDTTAYTVGSKIVANGGEQNDIIELKGNNEGVLSPAELAGGNGNDWLIGGGGDDWLSGDNEWDRLYGGGGSDTLSGGTDNDWLVGGAGADVLNGGEGFDIASYS